jgi:hypothetical protein
MELWAKLVSPGKCVGRIHKTFEKVASFGVRVWHN